MKRINGKLGMVIALVTALLLQPCAGIKADAKTVRKSVTVYCGKTKTVKKWKAGAVKRFKVTYSKKNVAAVKVKKNGIQITGKKAGKVNVTVKVTKKNKKADTYKYAVVVKEKAQATEETEESETTVEPKATKKPVVIVESETEPTQTVTPSPTADNYVSPYSYELEVLNTGTLYTGCRIVIYTKTNNMEGISLQFDSNSYDSGGPASGFDDVKYDESDKIGWAVGNKVSGGYLYSVTFQKAGTYTVTLQEVIQVDYEYKDVASIEITVEDYTQAEEAWMQQVIEDNTTDEMSVKEKMDAIREYVYNEFSYSLNNEDGNVFLLAVAMLPYWEGKIINCWDATDIMMRFADYFGLESEATYAGYLAHYYATVYIDGVGYEYDACPYSYTGYITEWEYIL